MLPLQTSTMRRRALDYVCATCRHCAESRTVLHRTSRRYVQISATPSSAEPQQSLDAKDAVSGQSAGMLEDMSMPREAFTECCSNRCPIRSARQHLLPPFRIHIAVAEPLYAKRDASRLQWQARECMCNGVSLYRRRSMLTHNLGDFHALPS